jgi:hypothetical protein
LCLDGGVSVAPLGSEQIRLDGVVLVAPFGAKKSQNEMRLDLGKWLTYELGFRLDCLRSLD